MVSGIFNKGKGIFNKGKEFLQDLNNSKTTTNTRLKNHINTSATPHNVGTSSVPTISGQHYEVPNFPTRGRKISRNPSLYYDTYDSGDEEGLVKAQNTHYITQSGAGEAFKEFALGLKGYFEKVKNNSVEYQRLLQDIPNFSVPLKQDAQLPQKRLFRGTRLPQELLQQINALVQKSLYYRTPENIRENQDLAHRLLHGFSGQKDKICSVSTVPEVADKFSQPRQGTTEKSVSIFIDGDVNSPHPARGATFHMNRVPIVYAQKSGLMSEHEIILDQTNHYAIERMQKNPSTGKWEIYMSSWNPTPYQEPQMVKDMNARDQAKITQEIEEEKKVLAKAGLPLTKEEQEIRRRAFERHPQGATQAEQIAWVEQQQENAVFNKPTHTLTHEDLMIQERAKTRDPVGAKQKNDVRSARETIEENQVLAEPSQNWNKYGEQIAERAYNKDPNGTMQKITQVQEAIKAQQAIAQQNAQHNQAMAQIQQQMQQANRAAANFMGTPSAAPVIGSQSMSDFMANLNQWHDGAMNTFGRR